MDTRTAVLAGFVIFCLCGLVAYFVHIAGVKAETSILALMTGVFGLITGGGAGYVAGKSKGGADDSEV